MSHLSEPSASMSMLWTSSRPSPPPEQALQVEEGFQRSLQTYDLPPELRVDSSQICSDLEQQLDVHVSQICIETRDFVRS